MPDLSHFSILIFLAFFLRSTWWQFLTEAKHQNCTGQNSAILRFSCTAPSSVGCPFQPLLWVLSQVSQKDVCTCPRQSSISGCKKYLTENYTNRYLSAIVFSNVTPRETRPAASLNSTFTCFFRGQKGQIPCLSVHHTGSTYSLCKVTNKLLCAHAFGAGLRHRHVPVCVARRPASVHEQCSIHLPHPLILSACCLSQSYGLCLTIASSRKTTREKWHLPLSTGSFLASLTGTFPWISTCLYFVPMTAFAYLACTNWIFGNLVSVLFPVSCSEA